MYRVSISDELAPLPSGYRGVDNLINDLEKVEKVKALNLISKVMRGKFKTAAGLS